MVLKKTHQEMASLAGFFNSIVAGDLAAITRGINDGIDVNSRDGPQVL